MKMKDAVATEPFLRALQEARNFPPSKKYEGSTLRLANIVLFAILY
jgi:hypothetical protein